MYISGETNIAHKMNKRLIEQRVKQTLQAEAVAVSALEHVLDEAFYSAIDMLIGRTGKILVTGIGKSGFVAMKMVATLTSLGHEAFFLNPLNALHGDSGIIKNGDVLVVFSFSGSSPELVHLVRHFKKHFSMNVLSITGNKESQLAELGDEIIAFSIEEEGCPLDLAPMASTTASLVIADCIASALTSPETFTQEDFAQFHPAGNLGLSLKKVKEIMREGDQTPRVSMNTSFEDVLTEITLQKAAQIVGVVDEEGRLVGAFADGDIRRMLIKHGDLRGKEIHSFMNANPKTVTAEDSLLTALNIMKEYKVNNLFVTDSENTYIGFIHIHDIVGD